MSSGALAASKLSAAQLAAALSQGRTSELDLTANTAIAGELVQVLLGSGQLPQLSFLDLTAVPLGDEALGRLLRSGQLTGLKTLLLGGLMHQTLGLPARRGGPFAAVYHCDAGPLTLEALAEAELLPQLETLELSYALAPVELWRRFTTCPLAARLRRLGVYGELAQEAALNLVHAAPRLQALGLCLCGVGDGWAAALVEAPLAQTLRRLMLPLNALTETGIETLVNAPLPELAWLDLWGAPLSQRAIDALSHRRGAPRLRHLNLSDKTSIPTGVEDVWYDQGFEVGSAPGTEWLYAIKDKVFAGTGLDVTDRALRWPGSWLGDFAPGV